jgi:hypothetical protein
VARKRATASQADIEAVYNDWLHRQKVPALCRLSEERRKKIGKAIGSRGRVDLLVMFEWVWSSDDEGARFLRGDHPRSRPEGWLDLDNLLVARKLDARCEAAALWFSRERVAPLLSGGFDAACAALSWPADDLMPLWSLAAASEPAERSLADVVARLRGAPLSGMAIRRRPVAGGEA